MKTMILLLALTLAAVQPIYARINENEIQEQENLQDISHSMEKESWDANQERDRQEIESRWDFNKYKSE